MSMAVQVTPQLVANRRYASRRPLRLGSVLSDTGAEIVIHDISATGLLIETSQDLSTGETLIIDLPERGNTPATVAWSSGRYFGCQFELSIPVAAISAALLRSSGPKISAEVGRGPDISLLHSLVEAADADTHPEDDRYSLRARGVVLISLTALSWALIGCLAIVI